MNATDATSSMRTARRRLQRQRAGQRGEQARPVEPRTRVGFSAGRDVAVRGNRLQRKRGREAGDERGELAVLSVLERRVVGALELDADREVVAAAAAAPGGGAGVP